MFEPSSIDNQEVYDCYIKAKEKMQEAASSMLELKTALENKFMAISKTDRKLLEDEVTNICSASWCIHVQGFKIKQARAKTRIMSHCDKMPID